MLETPRQREIAGQILARNLKAAKRSRTRFMETGRELMRYGYSPNFDFDYQALPTDASLRAKVAKTSEAIQLMVPFLMPPQPYRMVKPKRFATEAAKLRWQVTEEYLNYTPTKTNLVAANRQIGTEAVVYGRGVAWVGKHPRKGVICSQFDSVRNLLVDPNAHDLDEASWVARRRERPKWEAMAEYPEAAAAFKKLQPSAKRESDRDSKFEWEKQDASTDCIVYWEVYCRTGLHHYRGGVELLKDAARAKEAPTDEESTEAEADDTPMKYLVTEDGRLLHVCDWEIPWHVTHEWPCAVLDFYENPDSPWPVSPLEAGLGYQRYMNLIVTMLMGKYRFTSRTVIALAKQNRNGIDDEDKNRVLVGEAIEAIEIEVNGETRKLSDFIQQFDYSNEYIAQGLNFLSAIEERFDKATGLYDILYSGQTETQIRTAQDASIKDRNSRSRIEDMRDRVAHFEAELARKESFAAHFLEPRERIAELLGPEAGANWGALVRPEVLENPRVFVEEYLAQGMDPMEALNILQSAKTLDQIANEADFEIEVSSIRRHDIDQQIDALKELFNQVGSKQIGSPDPAERAMAYSSLSRYYRLLGLEEDADEQVAQAQRLKAQAEMQDQIMAMQARMGIPPGAAPAPAAPAAA